MTDNHDTHKQTAYDKHNEDPGHLEQRIRELAYRLWEVEGRQKEETTNIGTERKNSSKTRRNRPIRHLLPEVIEPERIVTKAPICELL
jgi:hypothetical protein